MQLRFSKKEKIFLVVYPFAHCAFCLFDVLIAMYAVPILLRAGQLGEDVLDGIHALCALLNLPLFILQSIGLHLPTQGYLDWLWIFLNSIFCGFCFVFFHRWLIKS